MSKPPRWLCRDEKDQQCLEDWTNRALDSMFEPSAADIAREQDPTPVFHQELSTQLKRGRVIVAARAGESETLARLATTPELLRLALKPHKRGREKGEQRPRDLPQLAKWGCIEALADVEHIRRIWKNEFGKRNRSESPTAMEIAARRWGIDPEVLITFKKNRHRRS
jgi:hypothetical protein